MHKTILHIGSNVGIAINNLVLCITLLGENIGQIVAESSVYKTEAWGLKEQSDFLNKAVIIETELSINQLLKACQEIEAIFGRERKIKWGPRIIDIDIIFYDDLIYENDEIQIPHPRMHERNFVLYPLYEIIPDWKHPVLKKSITQLKENSIDTLSIVARK